MAEQLQCLTPPPGKRCCHNHKGLGFESRYFPLEPELIICGGAEINLQNVVDLLPTRSRQREIEAGFRTLCMNELLIGYDSK